ncbi:hypothetical protein [Brevundimonas aurantiaca]|uniref:hypothetical protein n=1 Tax=Brevundimonas aurantiaca TaxID=74316 RepID=UPI00174DDDCA|nr:hypothetical protein [Brevundimonas aurantiaca]
MGAGLNAGAGVGGGGVGSGTGGVGSSGALTGAVAASSGEGSGCGLSAAAAAITVSDTIDTGTEFTSGGASSAFCENDTKASATTPACRAMEPRIAGLGRRNQASGAVSVIRFSLVKPEALSRAITRATA